MTTAIRDPHALLPITDAEFQQVRTLVYARLGINLTEKKRTLVSGRLQKVLREKHFESFEDYFKYLLADTTGRALSELADRISTNHTFFYRESAHFRFFQERALPQALARLKAEDSKDLRIWCAGCSSGEEPYTLVMLMMERLGSEYASWNAGVLATDVSNRALSLANAGVYAVENVEKMPDPLRKKYFTRAAEETCTVIPRVKREVVFRRFNLMNRVFPFRKPFHMIFCRNVMIYFDVPTRGALVSRFWNSLEPGGYLFVGHAESLRSNEAGFEYVEPAVYRKKT